MNLYRLLYVDFAVQTHTGIRTGGLSFFGGIFTGYSVNFSFGTTM